MDYFDESFLQQSMTYESESSGEDEKPLIEKLNGKLNESDKSAVVNLNQKEMKSGCAPNCRFKCRDKVPENVRRKIFDKFWSIGDISKQWRFMERYMIRNEPKERKASSFISKDNKVYKKNFSHHYFLPVGKVNIKVCRTMFTHTLGVSNSKINTIDIKVRDYGYVVKDKRGKHGNRPCRTNPKITESVQQHIEMFIPVPSHYCRKNSKKIFLDESLNINQMYRLYQEWREGHPTTDIASANFYRFTVRSKYDIYFQQPKQDKCIECETYAEFSPKYKRRFKENYELHLSHILSAQTLLQADKEIAKTDPSILIANVDLQNVMELPHAKDTILYFKRKLHAYNLTIYDMVTQEIICNIWDETTAQKGGNEIASMIWNYIFTNANKKRKFIFYSVDCSAQSMNKYLLAMYLFAAVNLGVEIVHRYLIEGHMQSEAEYSRSVIESKCRRSTLYNLNQWCEVIEEARVKQPYATKIFDQPEIYNFQELIASQNWYRVTKSEYSEIMFHPIRKTVFVKYNLTDEPVEINIKKPNVNWEEIILKPAYTSKLKLNEDKARDLKELCENYVIPMQFWDFYESRL